MQWPTKCNGAIEKLSTSHDAMAGSSGVTWPKKSCHTSFLLSWPKECNGIVDIVGKTWSFKRVMNSYKWSWNEEKAMYLYKTAKQSWKKANAKYFKSINHIWCSTGI